MGRSKIEWTDDVWNPVTGCTPISEGCQNCYAQRMAKRLAGRCGYPEDEPLKVTLHPERLGEPLKWKKPRRVFVCSMGDLFHEDVPDKFIYDVWDVMVKCSQHTFLLLTKRPERMKTFVSKVMANRKEYAETLKDKETRLKAINWAEKPVKNIWLGVTTENQEQANIRIPVLLQIPAAVRFVSVEPMLGPVNIAGYLGFLGPRRMGDGLTYYWAAPKLDWVICGGETGPNARPCHPDWVRSLRDQCQDAGTPFFFKQWGEWTAEYPQGMSLKNVKMTYCHGTTFYRIGKKLAGRMLDGKEWNEFPEGKVKT